MSDSIRRELHLVLREVLHHQGSQVTIFSKREEVLLVQSVDVGLGVFVNDQ